MAAIVALAGSMSAAYAEGSCNYVQENMFAGPFNVCQEPVEAEACAELGETDDNADASCIISQVMPVVWKSAVASRAVTGSAPSNFKSGFLPPLIDNKKNPAYAGFFFFRAENVLIMLLT